MAEESASGRAACWAGAIPVRFALAADEVTTLHPPPPHLIEQLYPPPDASDPFDGYPSSNEGVDQCEFGRYAMAWRSRMVYWDFATKHWTRGIWRHVALRYTLGSARLHRQLSLRSQPSEPFASAEIGASVRWRPLAHRRRPAGDRHSAAG